MFQGSQHWTSVKNWAQSGDGLIFHSGASFARVWLYRDNMPFSTCNCHLLVHIRFRYASCSVLNVGCGLSLCGKNGFNLGKTSSIWYLLPLQIILRVNCLSTEFSSQKGVTGMPMHFVTDTYEDIDRNCTNPVHRAYCRVKMFRDKVY